MPLKFKKPNIILIVIGTILSAYFGYLVAGAWREGIEINAFLDRFSMVCAYPLNDYVNEFTNPRTKLDKQEDNDNA